ncbi:MAG: tRNA (guanosine(46)-N7)-methyltransferase TrmB [Puniceicoccales bacterium]|nr:tRNA (guanosine(46)-N7)-methyltransferase TrmB [Puniceicoccales bacterium]
MSESARAMIEASRVARIAALRERLTEQLKGTNQITLEIGCGHGHFLAAYAEAFPEKYCIGVDLLTKRIERGNRKRDRGEFTNLDFIKAEATELLEAIPPHIHLAEIFFLFPDPWPKKRHHKNRLIQAAMLDRLAALSLPGQTRLHFRTDDADYFAWSMNLVSKNPAWKLLPEAPWPFEQETFFSKILPVYQSLIAQRQ